MPFRSSGRGAYGPQGQRVLKGPLAPVWVTGAGSVGSANLGAAVSVQLSATDDSGDAPTYTIASGSLPTGLSLSSSGLISGTLGGSAGTATFTVNATDVNGRVTTSGSFTFTSIQPFSEFGAEFLAPSGFSTQTFSAGANGSYTIPVNGTYEIEMAGSLGGTCNGTDINTNAGRGSRYTLKINLAAGRVLRYVCGSGAQYSPDSNNSNGGGQGGGGSFLFTSSGNTLIAAAGGGGAGSIINGGSAPCWYGTNGTAPTVTTASNARNGCGAGSGGGNGSACSSNSYPSKGWNTMSGGDFSSRTGWFGVQARLGGGGGPGDGNHGGGGGGGYSGGGAGTYNFNSGTCNTDGRNGGGGGSCYLHPNSRGVVDLGNNGTSQGYIIIRAATS